MRFESNGIMHEWMLVIGYHKESNTLMETIEYKYLIKL